MIADEAWKEQVRKHTGIVLSIDEIQPDNGNETIYLMRDMLTGRILHAEHVTESTKERLKEILLPVVALNVPVLGVISDAQPTELQAVAELWPAVPHQICQFHTLREAGRLIYNADHRVKTDLRIRMQQKTISLTFSCVTRHTLERDALDEWEDVTENRRDHSGASERAATKMMT